MNDTKQYTTDAFERRSVERKRKHDLLISEVNNRLCPICKAHPEPCDCAYLPTPRIKMHKTVRPYKQVLLDRCCTWAIGAGHDKSRVLRAANIVTDSQIPDGIDKLTEAIDEYHTTDCDCQCPDHRYSFDRDGSGWLCKHILAVMMDMRLNGEEVDW